MSETWNLILAIGGLAACTGIAGYMIGFGRGFEKGVKWHDQACNPIHKVKWDEPPGVS